ncbi:MAG: endonuclease/exonuclease/phosphatase family protein [Candidatus Curtissbacteria bacterium]
MILKVIQVNVFRGKYLDDLIVFLKKQNPDIVIAQEVTGYGANLYEDNKADTFELLRDALGYKAVLDKVNEFSDDEDAFFANVVFSKYPITQSEVVSFVDYRKIKISELGDPEINPLVSRHMIDVVIEIGTEKIHAISVHGVWTAPPTDNEDTLGQAYKIVEHLRSLGDTPFVMGGDFNMPLGSETINIVSAAVNNLMVDSGVSGTLNPKVHYLGKNLLIDFIFASKHFKKVSLEVPQITVSDHLPVVAELELL